MQIIDGKQLAKEITDSVKQEIQELGITPGLAVFLVGDDEASQVYVRLKEKACKEVGIDFHKYLCEQNSSQQEILDAINFLNQDPKINGILVQLPLPDGFNEQEVIDKLDAKKDVDGFHPQTLQAFLEGKSDFVPGLSHGIVRLIEQTKEPIEHKSVIIIANSDVFSQPLEKLLQEKTASVQVVSPDEPNLKALTQEADILIVAIGRPKMITNEFVKEDAILIDVGTTKVDGKIVGDIDFDSVDGKAAWITPVPGGVGPVTVAMLLENTLKLAKEQMTQ